MGTETMEIDESNNRGGFTGTEFSYPILYAVKGVTNPASLMEEGLQPVHGRQHIDNLWMIELAESIEPDRDRYFITDDSFRSLCVGLNQDSNGWALLVGRVDENNLDKLIAEMSSRNLKPFAYGKTANILRKANIQFTDLGPRETGAIYFAQLLVRYALIYARDLGGDPHEISHSIEEYAPGVVLLLGEPEMQTRSLVQGLLGLGVPIVSLQKDYGLVGHLYNVQTIADMMGRVWRLPNIRVRLVERASAELPVPSGPVYRRETLKDDEVAIRVGGSGSGFIVSMPSNVEKDTVKVIGSLDDASGFSVMIELGNPDMEPDITLWVDAVIQSVSKYAKGVKIQNRGSGGVELQMTREAIDAGFTLDHLGNMIITELRNEFPSIGSVKVSFVLDGAEEERLRVMVDKYKNERKHLIDSASEDNLDTFYGCTRCRSFSLGHACTVTPDRPAQCSKPWYMLKAYAVLAPGNTYNPCTLIEKGECLDPIKGEYVGVNNSTEIRTEGRVERVYLHSIFEYPHTACSCFQNVAYYIPEVDGIAIMDRGYKGLAPGGMTWTRLANMVAGRQYRDGAATIATQYLRSPKFLQADGGYARVVWMTDTLKNFAGDTIPLVHRDRILTEENVTTLDELKALIN
jgi:acetyl-CoA decarbonylase/synthase complex subunit beta